MRSQHYIFLWNLNLGHFAEFVPIYRVRGPNRNVLDLRSWLLFFPVYKMKRDYLEEGAMADTADLVVLGAYYGTGNKGGLMSIFLMGVWDPAAKQWCTVARCGNGHDDKTLERLNRELKMKKISKVCDVEQQIPQ